MYRLVAILFFCFQTSTGFAQPVNIGISGLPAYHNNGDAIYLAGSFNGWNPNDSSFRFDRDQKGRYYRSVNLAPGRYEFKLTRGSWSNTETKKGGASLPNRVLVVGSDSMVSLVVEDWSDHFSSQRKSSTAGKGVHIIDTAFFIPQLKRYRRIWVYLPPHYSSSKERYPVLYMQDGQNLFDDSTAYAGEWGIDECIDTIAKKCIVVAIDHGGSSRINEYSPYDMEKYGKGEGKAYANFLAKKLKPFIDKRFRTKKGKTSTLVAGSSMGGLISFYTILRYPGVFGGAGIFSPSFWIAPALTRDINKYGKKVRAKIYFYVGKKEGQGMVPDMLAVFLKMASVSHAKMTTVIRDEGMHNESTWRKEFPLFYRWINP